MAQYSPYMKQRFGGTYNFNLSDTQSTKEETRVLLRGNIVPFTLQTQFSLIATEELLMADML